MAKAFFGSLTNINADSEIDIRAALSPEKPKIINWLFLAIKSAITRGQLYQPLLVGIVCAKDSFNKTVPNFASTHNKKLRPTFILYALSCASKRSL